MQSIHHRLSIRFIRLSSISIQISAIEKTLGVATFLHAYVFIYCVCLWECAYVYTDLRNNEIYEINVVFTFDAFRKWIFCFCWCWYSFLEYIIKLECKDKESADSFDCKTARARTHTNTSNELKVKEAEQQKHYIMFHK